LYYDIAWYFKEKYCFQTCPKHMVAP